MEVLAQQLPPLKAPKIHFIDGSILKNIDHQDIYFSRQGGLQESHEVFLNANKIPERFKPNHHLILGELGFGTGLNFLTTWKSWCDTGRRGRLTFISVEHAPLEAHHIEKVLTPFFEISQLTQTLIKQLPDRVPGWHPIDFDDYRVRLLLGFGDAHHLLKQLKTKIDAWYFDGFSPAKNESLWQLPLFKEVARLSHSETTFGTFSCAGVVKKNLTEVGFKIEKKKGFAYKKDRLQGQFVGPKKIKHKTPPKKIAIIGGGLAGMSVAHALARRGLQSIVFEKGTVACGASGNPAGMLKPALTLRPTVASMLSLSAYGFTRRLVNNFSHDQVSHNLNGIVQLEQGDNFKKKIIPSLNNHPWLPEHISIVDNQQASTLCGQKVIHSGLHYTHGGWVAMNQYTHALSQHPLINIKTDHHIDRFDSTNGSWNLWADDNCLGEFSHVVFCCAQESHIFFDWLPIEIVRGQMIIQNHCQQKLNTPVSFGGFVKIHNNQLIAGASFKKYFNDLEVSPTETDEIINHADSYFRESLFDKNKPVDARVSQRTFLKDHLPVAGRIPFNTDTFISPSQSNDHLYVLTGLAARGLLWSALLADTIACDIADEVVPLDRKLHQALSPMRFVLRKMKKNTNTSWAG